MGEFADFIAKFELQFESTHFCLRVKATEDTMIINAGDAQSLRIRNWLYHLPMLLDQRATKKAAEYLGISKWTYATIQQESERVRLLVRQQRKSKNPLVLRDILVERIVHRYFQRIAALLNRGPLYAK